MVAHAAGCVVIHTNRVGVGVEPNKLVLFVGLLVGLKGGQLDMYDLLMKARAVPPLEPLLKSELDATTALKESQARTQRYVLAFGLLALSPIC
jgi:hypothetical protein